MTTRTVASSLRAPARSAGVPILVEEELLLINRSTGRALPVTKPVGDALAPVARAVGSTVTLVSSPATELAAVRGDLLRKRRAAAAVAAEHDADLVAVGAAGEHSDGLVASSPNVCGLVVQVGVPSDLAVQVCRRLGLGCRVLVVHRSSLICSTPPNANTGVGGSQHQLANKLVLFLSTDFQRSRTWDRSVPRALMAVRSRR